MIGISQQAQQRGLYSDLDLSFTIHPIRNDIIPLTDVDAIRGSIRNLISTNYFDRPFKPFLGSNIYKSLFEPMDRFTRIQLSETIKSMLIKYEPRIKDVRVDISDNEEAHSVSITISCVIRENRENADIEITFRRFR